MARSLSMDLRRRVIQAVNEGASRREAAARFGVSAASAVRWCARLRDTGDASAKRQGGDRVSHRIEAHAELILGLLEKERDQTLFELRDKLAAHGVRTNHTTLWRFFRRHGVTRKKRPRTPANRTVPTL
jgi:transposase